ncbi:MAG: precorrin-6y C5,15-methyltransferase (decarboxylating) subunit CbiE [Alphaproteobacteria bacterium]
MRRGTKNGRPWLTVLGIGEDGIEGLPPAARALISGAEVVVGGLRNLDLARPAVSPSAECIVWGGLDHTLAAIGRHRGRRVVVVATGDPMFYGMGATLARTFDPAEMTVVPHPGAYSLAAARLGWALQDVVLLSVHGRPVEGILPHLAPGRRLLVLSEDGVSPAIVAALLGMHGYGASRLVAFEHLGGPLERRVEALADQWPAERMADLNTLAITCPDRPERAPLAAVPGLPDDVYLHDGQLTKREIRAATLAALAPWPGAMLWDIGSGAGSIAIEWMRVAPSCRAVAVERDPGRAGHIARNALVLGVPGLEIVTASAPEVLRHLPAPPDAVFVGGGTSRAGVLETCWERLRPGGRLVVNAVTLEGEARLLDWHRVHGGELVRLSVSRLRPVGRLIGWTTLAPVTQYRGGKG